MSQRALDDLLLEIRACRHCAAQLPHEPRPVLRASASARLCVVGQAPGTRVHASGVPFTDRSGERLRDWLGLSVDQFYDESKVAIIPMGFCFPGLNERGADLPPRTECAPLWRKRLFALLPNIRLQLLIGRYAQSWHLDEPARMTVHETVSHWRRFPGHMMPLPHPSWRNNAWLNRNPWFESELLPVLRRRVSAALEGR